MPAARWRSVDFPEPLRPVTATTSPAGSSPLASRTARSTPPPALRYSRDTPRKARTGGVTGSRAGHRVEMPRARRRFNDLFAARASAKAGGTDGRRAGGGGSTVAPWPSPPAASGGSSSPRPRLALVAAAAAALLGVRGSAAARAERAARARAAEAARRAGLAPRDPLGGPLRPAPLVSRGRRVAASRRGAEVLVDGVYRAESWGGGVPSEAAPAWAAVRIGPGPTRVLLSWTSSHNHDYRELLLRRAGGLPDRDLRRLDERGGRDAGGPT